MEEFILQIAQTGNATAIIVGGIIYLIIYLQRKNTGAKRDDATAELQKQIDELKQLLSERDTQIQLMMKDIDILKDENIGIKADIKEIKVTLQTMALALERIAAKYDDK